MKTIVIVGSILLTGAVMTSGAAMGQATTPGAVRDANPTLPTENRRPFDGRDVNGDGKLSPTETAAGSQSFMSADKNGDGSLDRNEYSQMMRNTETPARPSTATPRTEYPGIRGDGVTDPAGSSTTIPPVAPAPGTMPPSGTLPPAHGAAPPAPSPGDAPSSLPRTAPAPTAPTR